MCTPEAVFSELKAEAPWNSEHISTYDISTHVHFYFQIVQSEIYNLLYNIAFK